MLAGIAQKLLSVHAACTIREVSGTQATWKLTIVFTFLTRWDLETTMNTQEQSVLLIKKYITIIVAGISYWPWSARHPICCSLKSKIHSISIGEDK